ncbi:hypothetical protein P22_0329 [Propionispora sp. 2/2-37]|uniref:VanW family protein n=1 Tax=Propionispora sp. 2/2-37 TaxID=1677858 RepID=UPI0006BEC060|nr:VanW family protein [Propionispora sp. 2/2-37]CUH94263.1 hypothetical protein P22_0329 [Propionispora sp. 2/2-37]
MQIATGKRTTNILLFLAIIVLFSSVSLLAANAAFVVRDEIYTGVTIGEIPVGGLSLSAAQKKIAATMNERLGKTPLQLTYNGQIWKINAEDIDLRIDVETLAQHAYNIGRTGNIIHRLQERYMTINHGYNLPLSFSYNRDKLQNILSNIAAVIDREPTSAKLTYNDLKIVTIPEVNGRHMDRDKTLAEIIDTINNSHNWSAVSLIVNEVVPPIVAADLTDIDDVLALYTTQFNPSNGNRVQNIQLAAKSINNILLRSGEIFSFNQTVGLRLEEYGYKEAPVFIDGKLVPDWGGGVCQVSSTLYNAALLADMAIVERTAHYRPPNYVPLGQDATVADNLLDFKFKNTSRHNIFISSKVGANQLTVYIFGKSGNLPEITIEATEKKILEPNTIIKQDPSLEVGKEVIEVEGERGFLITTHRIKRVNGIETGWEFLATDEFPPENRVVRVGTKTMANSK